MKPPSGPIPDADPQQPAIGACRDVNAPLARVVTGMRDTGTRRLRRRVATVFAR